MRWNFWNKLKLNISPWKTIITWIFCSMFLVHQSLELLIPVYTLSFFFVRNSVDQRVELCWQQLIYISSKPYNRCLQNKNKHVRIAEIWMLMGSMVDQDPTWLNLFFFSFWYFTENYNYPGLADDSPRLYTVCITL